MGNNNLLYVVLYVYIICILSMYSISKSFVFNSVDGVYMFVYGGAYAYVFIRTYTNLHRIPYTTKLILNDLARIQRAYTEQNWRIQTALRATLGYLYTFMYMQTIVKLL